MKEINLIYNIENKKTYAIKNNFGFMLSSDANKFPGCPGDK